MRHNICTSVCDEVVVLTTAAVVDELVIIVIEVLAVVESLFA